MSGERTGSESSQNGNYAEAKYYNPPNVLAQKAGRGGFDPLLVERANDYLETHKFDFPDIAGGILDRLNEAILAAKKKSVAGKPVINSISGPVMELKANGGMFHYPLVSDIANILLNFLEELDELNTDGFNIIDVHQKTLDVIIKNKLRGEVGPEGQALANELHKACVRYRKKHSVALDVE